MGYKRTATVSIGMVRILKSYARHVGVDFNSIVSTLDINSGIFDTEDARISALLFDTLWQKIIETSKDPNPGLNFGQQMTLQYPGGSLLFTMMINCATVGHALKVFTRYHRIMADVIQPVIKSYKSNKINESLTALSWETPDLFVQNHIHLSEALICAFYSILTHLSQGTIIPVSVCFTHQRKENSAELENYFKVPISFESAYNELVIRTSALDIDILLANQELFKILETHAVKIVNTIDKDKIWSNRVFNLISKTLLNGGTADITNVATNLAVSKRTLQEKLKSEKTCFRDLIESVRKQIAVEYLTANQLAICDLAFLLGYSDQSAFNHAFKRWTGKTPKTYIRDLV